MQLAMDQHLKSIKGSRNSITYNTVKKEDKDMNNYFSQNDMQIA